MTNTEHIHACDEYLGERSGKYEWRCVRYDHALKAMETLVGHKPMSAWTYDLTVCDVGAGWTEFGRRMFEEGWRSRYFPVDGCLDGTDLEIWTPPRSCDFFVALELLEHLGNPGRLVRAMQERATKGIVISTPNPETTDVLGMDRTHKTPITKRMLDRWNFEWEVVSFYGQPNDSLFGVWAP